MIAEDTHGNSKHGFSQLLSHLTTMSCSSCLIREPCWSSLPSAAANRSFNPCDSWLARAACCWRVLFPAASLLFRACKQCLSLIAKNGPQHLMKGGKALLQLCRRGRTMRANTKPWPSHLHSPSYADTHIINCSGASTGVRTLHSYSLEKLSFAVSAARVKLSTRSTYLKYKLRTTPLILTCRTATRDSLGCCRSKLPGCEGILSGSDDSSAAI